LLTDRRATIRSVLKVVHFLRRKKRARFGLYGFLHFHTQPDPKQGIQKFLRHFPTTLVPSLTLQIYGIVQSSIERPVLEFFVYYLSYSRSRYLVTWQREVKLCKVSDGTIIVGKVLEILVTLLLVRLFMRIEMTLAFVGGSCCPTLLLDYDYVLHIVNFAILYFNKFSKSKGNNFSNDNRVAHIFELDLHLFMTHLYTKYHLNQSNHQ
jgi:hypothetical protein